MSEPEKHELRCPHCNALMYERTVKRGEFKGLTGHGCPICFFLTPDHLYERRESKDDEGFKFWTSPDDEE